MRRPHTIVPHPSRRSARGAGVSPATHVRCDVAHRGDVLPYKDQYRAALDSAPLNKAQQEAFIDEAQLGFILAKKLFDSLA